MGGSSGYLALRHLSPQVLQLSESQVFICLIFACLGIIFDADRHPPEFFIVSSALRRNQKAHEGVWVGDSPGHPIGRQDKERLRSVPLSSGGTLVEPCLFFWTVHCSYHGTTVRYI